MPARRSRHRQDPVVSLIGRLIGPAKIIAGTVVGLAAFVYAWHQLGWPVPASIQYVDVTTDTKVGAVNTHIQAATTDVSAKVESATTNVNNKVDALNKRLDSTIRVTLENRVETLTAAKNRNQGELSDLQLKLRALGAKSDPGYTTMIQSRVTQLDQEIKNIDEQITKIQQVIGKGAVQ